VTPPNAVAADAFILLASTANTATTATAVAIVIARRYHHIAAIAAMDSFCWTVMIPIPW
jgi:hypothetical protein